MTTTKRLLVMIPLIIACVGCDRLTKSAAREHLASAPGFSYLGDLLRLQYAENPGAFLGLGASLPESVRFWVFTVSVGAVLLATVLFVLNARTLRPAAASALALVLGGGLSNFFDRLFNGGMVIDFLNLGIGPVRTGVFNLADVAISFGVVLLFLCEFLRKASEKEKAPGGFP